MNKVRFGMFFLALLVSVGFAVVARAAVQASYSFADRFSEVHAVYRSIFRKADGTRRSKLKSNEVVQAYAQPASDRILNRTSDLDLYIDGGLADELFSRSNASSTDQSSCPENPKKGGAGAELIVSDVDHLVALRLAGVTPEFVRDLSRLGYRNLEPDELRSLRDNGVEIQLVRALSERGYGSVSVEDLIRLRQSGVDAKFVRELYASTSLKR